MAVEIRTITVTVGANSSVKTTVTYERDLNISQIQATERSGAALTNVHVSFDIDGVPIIRPNMPVAQLGTNYETGMPLAFTLKKGSNLGVTVTNNTSSSVTIDFCLLVEA